MKTGDLELAYLLDGLRSEREQGIAIDVAYRHFSTPKRRFISRHAKARTVHAQHGGGRFHRGDGGDPGRRAKGDSAADASTRLHFLPSGFPRLVLAVNKMGLVDFREEIFGTIADEFRSFAERLGTASGDFIPICATAGDNVVARSGRTGWYQGLSLLEHLETVPLCLDPSKKPFRLPVQTVIRQGDFRGYAGQIASGSVKPGDEIVALPSEALPWPDGDRKEAFAPQSVTLTLDKHLDAGRGDILADSSRPQRYSPAAPLQRPGLQQVRSRRKYPAR